MVVLRVILGVILGLCVVGLVESRLNPSPGSVPVEIGNAVLGFAALGAYFLARQIVSVYRRRRASARGFPVGLRERRDWAYDRQ
jgi:hypothetical protein